MGRGGRGLPDTTPVNLEDRGGRAVRGSINSRQDRKGKQNNRGEVIKKKRLDKIKNIK